MLTSTTNAGTEPNMEITIGKTKNEIKRYSKKEKLEVFGDG